MLNGYDCSCTRLTASATDIASKSSSHSLWFTLDDFDIGGVLVIPYHINIKLITIAI